MQLVSHSIMVSKDLEEQLHRWWLMTPTPPQMVCCINSSRLHKLIRTYLKQNKHFLPVKTSSKCGKASPSLENVSTDVQMERAVQRMGYQSSAEMTIIKAGGA